MFVAMTSNTKLSRNGEKRHPCLVLDSSWEGFQFFTIKYYVDCGHSQHRKENEVPTLTSSHLMMYGSTSILKNSNDWLCSYTSANTSFFTLNRLLERI